MARTPLFAALRRAFRKASTPEGATPDTDTAAWSRRDFVKATAAAVGALPAASLLQACGDDDPKTPAPSLQSARIAIVGGGMAGLHCAYRLLKDHGVKATLYEGSSRTGGRIHTARGMFSNDQVAELGGELIDTGHLTMHALAEDLGLQLDDRFANEPPGFARDTFFFQGRLVPEAEIVEAFRPVAAEMNATLAAAEEDDALFEQLDTLSIVQWLDSLGDKANELIKAVIIESYIGEYGLEATEQSIFNVLYLLDHANPEPFRIFGDSDERYHTHLGNDAFTTALANDLTDQIQLNTKLTAVRAGASKAYAITLERDGQTFDEEFDHLVIAIPFSTLRDVDLQLPSFPEDKLQAIREVGYGTNAKLMMEFTAPVWRADHNASGSSVSDLGIQNTWDTTIGQSGPSAILTNFAGGSFGLAMDQGTPEDRAQAVLPSIDQIFPDTSAAYVTGSAVRMHWPSSPWQKGSYTCYKPTQWAFYGLEGQRVDNIHFCGEHCSLDFQGYMEGAAETGALVAVEIAADYGAAVSEGALRVLGPKLLMPQSTFQAHRLRGLNWLKRRRAVRSLLRDLKRPR